MLEILKQSIYKGIDMNPGRQAMYISELELNCIDQYKDQFNIYYQLVYQVSQTKMNSPKTLTEWKTQKIFDIEDYYVHGSEFQVPRVHGQRYSDIHYAQKCVDEGNKQLLLMIEHAISCIMKYCLIKK